METKTRKLNFIVFLIALLLSLFISALDETIVSTSTSSIINHFKAMDQLSWISVANLITISGFQPLYGRLSSIFSCKTLLIFSILMFSTGSLMCAFSVDIIMFIISRAICGIGSSGLIALPFISISKTFNTKEQSIYLAIAEATYSLGNLVGPLVGGSIVDSLGWRFIFFVNLPICVVAICVLFMNRSKKDLSKDIGFKDIDFVGSFLLISCIICFVLGTNWGGNDYPWLSIPVIVTLIVCVILFVLFIIVEKKTTRLPIIPMSVFNRNVSISSFNTVVFASLLYIYLYYIPLYFTIKKDYSAFDSGLQLIPILLSSIVSVTISGYITEKFGYYRIILVLGNMLLCIGTGLLILDIESIPSACKYIIFIICGVGLGMCFQTTLITSQAASKKKDRSSVASLMNLFNTLGGSAGLAYSSVIYNNSSVSLMGKVIDDNSVQRILIDPLYIKNLSPDSIILVLGEYKKVFSNIYISILPVVISSFILSLFIKDIPLDNEEPKLKQEVSE